MIWRKLTFGVIAIALIWTSSAFAEQMTIKKTANPIAVAYPGVSIDILGVKPGMSVDAVKKVLIANYHSQPTSTSALTSMTYRTVNVSSQTYVTSLKVQDKHGGSMTVYFGGPATGNTVVEVDRVLVFPDVKKAPTVAAVRAALDKKYGPESWTTAHGAYIKWAFGKSGHTRSCSNGWICEAGGSFNPDPLDCARYKREMSSGDYVTVQADLSTSGQDSSRLYNLTMYLSDEADKAISCNAISKQIHAAAIAAYKKESATPGTVPKL